MLSEYIMQRLRRKSDSNVLWQEKLW